MKTACVRSHLNDKPPMPTNASLDFMVERMGFEPMNDIMSFGV